MKHAIITSILIISTLTQAAPQTPYFESADSTDGGKLEALVISETNESKVYLFGCSIDRTAVKFLGDSSFCSQNLTCTRGERAKNAIVENSTIKITVNCAISSASAGCRSQTWQKCAMDKILPDGVDENCLSDNPGTTKPGCPKVNSQGSSQESGKGVR